LTRLTRPKFYGWTPGGMTMRYGQDAGKGTLSVWGGEERVFADNTTQVPVYLGVAHAYEDVD